MFGELPIIGEKKVTVKNNSIKLPEFSLREHRETLCFLYLPDEIRLYSEKEYLNFLKIMEEICEKQKLGFVKTNEIKRYIYAKGYDESKVSKSLRIKSLKFLKENIELILVGANNHIKILTKEQYNQYKKV